MPKLCASSAENQSPAIPAQPAPSKSSQPTAADILGLNRQWGIWQQPVSLEMEMDQYLSDSNQGTGTLEFWQVILTFLQSIPHLFSLICIYYFRNIKIDILTSSSLQWISYPSRPQVCPVNGSSHLESRQWHLKDHIYQLNLWNLCRSWSFQFERIGLLNSQKACLGVRSWRSLNL